MNPSKPYHLIIAAATFITVCYLVSFMLISLFFYEYIQWYVLGISGILVFISSAVSFTYIFKKYIENRINVVYKTIQRLKLTREEKNQKINLNDDLIRQVNEEVIEWNKIRKEELEQMKKLEAYRKEFLGDVSHELKTPIFNLQGFILTLLDGANEDKEVSREYLKKSEKNIERMINLVEDLEIISRLESGEIKPEFSRFDIIALSRDVFEIMENKARKRQISLVFNESVKKDSQIYVWADKERIKQVLINLVDNSIKYGSEKGRTKLSFYDMFENILVEVSDNGIGIETKYIPRLFERFFRVDKSRSRNIGGSGLGLAIVKHILESHQQTINVRSTQGVGSTFSFTLNTVK